MYQKFKPVQKNYNLHKIVNYSAHIMKIENNINNRVETIIIKLHVITIKFRKF